MKSLTIRGGCQPCMGKQIPIRSSSDSVYLHSVFISSEIERIRSPVCLAMNSAAHRVFPVPEK